MTSLQLYFSGNSRGSGAPGSEKQNRRVDNKEPEPGGTENKRDTMRRRTYTGKIYISPYRAGLT